VLLVQRARSASHSASNSYSLNFVFSSSLILIVRHSRSRAFNRSSTARKCGFPSLAGASSPPLAESGFRRAIGGSPEGGRDGTEATISLTMFDEEVGLSSQSAIAGGDLL
jgi:hypothetical protein